MKQLTDKAIEVLANWWFDVFLGPDHDMGVDERDTGEAKFNATMARGLAGILADKHPVDPEKRQEFVDSLKKACHEDMEGKRSYWALGLGTDYHPEGTLAKAMEYAGIHPSRCSWKTSVQVRGRGIMIGAGYRAAWELLCDLEGNLPKERWVLKTTYDYDGRREQSVEYEYSRYAYHGAIAQRMDGDTPCTWEGWYEVVEVDEYADDPTDPFQRSWVQKPMPVDREAERLREALWVLSFKPWTDAAPGLHAYVHDMVVSGFVQLDDWQREQLQEHLNEQT